MRVELTVLQGWLARAYTKDHWRLPSWDCQDYIQEGLSVYLELENKYYKDLQTTPAHMMALFKTAWWRRVHDFARKEPKFCGGVDAILDAAMAAAPVKEGNDSLLLHTLLTSPTEAVSALGIVFSLKEARAVAAQLGWSMSRLRNATTQCLEEFADMPDAVTVLANATKCEASPGEERQDYLVRLVKATAELEEKVWERLPRVVQDWFNAAAVSINNSESIEDVASSAPKPKRRSPLKAVGSTPKHLLSPSARAREIMLLDKHITPTEVAAQLAAEGYAVPALNSLQAMRSDYRAVLRVLEEHGRLVVDPNEEEKERSSGSSGG